MLSRVFRGKFLAGLRAAFRRGRLRFPGRLAALARPQRFDGLIAEAVRTDWVVYARPPFGGAEVVLKYLARYTQRAAISNRRLVSLADGRYLGEVIRRAAPVEYRWVNYADYFPHHPKLAKMVPEGVGTGAVLVTATGAMTMPLNKIARYIGDGPENNTHFYATAEVRPKKG